MSEYKNAGIKSKKELAQRLIDGEVFWYGQSEDKIYYDGDCVDESPFRFDTMSLEEAWDEFAKLTTKTEWYENLDGCTPVLCYVDNKDELSNKNHINWVYEYDPSKVYKFKVGGSVGEGWKFATPVTKEDLL